VPQDIGTQVRKSRAQPSCAQTRPRSDSCRFLEGGQERVDVHGVDLFSVSVLAEDAPDGQYSLTRFYTALKH